MGYKITHTRWLLLNDFPLDQIPSEGDKSCTTWLITDQFNFHETSLNILRHYFSSYCIIGFYYFFFFQSSKVHLLFHVKEIVTLFGATNPNLKLIQLHSYASHFMHFKTKKHFKLRRGIKQHDHPPFNEPSPPRFPVSLQSDTPNLLNSNPFVQPPPTSITSSVVTVDNTHRLLQRAILHLERVCGRMIQSLLTRETTMSVLPEGPVFPWKTFFNAEAMGEKLADSTFHKEAVCHQQVYKLAFGHYKLQFKEKCQPCGF